MRRCRRRVGRLELSCAVVTIGLLLGGSVSLDRKGVPVSGRGAAKLERIAVSREPSGDWDRHYEVTAAFELPNGGASQATVRVPPEQPGVAHGALLPVRLDPAAPRDAHLAVGTRRFVEANRYHFLTPVLGCGILGMLAALAYRWRRPKRQATTGDETMARQEGRIMETKMPALSLMIALLSTPPESRLAAQDQAPADSIHACDLVTNADVEKVTRRRTQGPPDRQSNVQKTYSSCSFRQAGVGIVLSSKASQSQKHVYQELEVGGFDRANQPVPGVGDSAAIYFKPKGKDPEGFLVTYAGTRTLTIRVKIDHGQPSASAQPFAVGLAKIALAKLR